MDRKKALIITMEECSELTRVCSKILRHGDMEKYLCNLKEEMADVLAMIVTLQRDFDISDKTLELLTEARLAKMNNDKYK